MVAPPRLQRLSVSEAVERFVLSLDLAVAGQTLSAVTRENYARDLAELVTLAEDLRGEGVVLDDLTAEDVDLVVLAYGRRPDGRFSRAGAGGRTRGAGAQARFRNSVNRLFGHAESHGWVQASPMEHTTVRPRIKGLTGAHRKALSATSASALIEAARTDAPIRSAPHAQGRALRLRDEFLLRLLVETGPRVSEVCAADRADLSGRDDGTVWLHIRHGKGNKERWVPMSAGTYDVYRRYELDERPAARPREGDPSGTSVEDAERALLLSWRGRRMTPRAVQDLVDRAVLRTPAEVRRRVTPHGLRHTAATLLLNSGAADIHTVKDLLGHASIATTGVYLDTADVEMTQAVAAHPVTGSRAPRRGVSPRPATEEASP